MTSINWNRAITLAIVGFACISTIVLTGCEEDSPPPCYDEEPAHTGCTTPQG